jgi:hypothetical protein
VSGTIYRIYDMVQREGVRDMGYGYGCCSTASSQRTRSFLTMEERIKLLKEYKNDLEKETQGVVEKIKELEVA